MMSKVNILLVIESRLETGDGDDSECRLYYRRFDGTKSSDAFRQRR